jgi:hypothetical protein
MLFIENNQEWIWLYLLIILNMSVNIKNIFVEFHFLGIGNGTLHGNDINKYLELEINFSNHEFNFVFVNKVQWNM